MAYKTSSEKRRQVKDSVLLEIAQGESVRSCGGVMHAIGLSKVHARFCARGPDKYKFNINPNTLRADYELWICGGSAHWYLIPVQMIREMYEHPSAYPDRQHPEIRVVSVDGGEHVVGFAAPGIKRDLRPYYRAVFPTG